MNYRNHTTRCPHGFCVDTIGCPECGIDPNPAAAGQLLRKLHHPSANSEASRERNAPSSYRHNGRHGSTGNRNAKRKYQETKWG